jgi:hypothetical protein
MDVSQTVERIVAVTAAITALTTALHALGAAAQPWARALLSILPLDVVGAWRRAQGKTGAAGAPEPKS